MSNWIITMKKADFNRIAEEFHITPMAARIIRNRDIVEKSEIEKFLYGTLEDLYLPEQFKDMELLTGILLQKIKEKKRIRIIGDYDIDGICASYILKKGLELCEAAVDAVIPHRIHDGYGINMELIDAAFQDGIDTMLTCDNGIAAKEQIAHGNALGMTMLITDHHEVPFLLEEDSGEKETKKELLPEAAAIVNPKQKACSYPYQEICGAMIAFKVVCSLLEQAGKPKEILRELLEFAAIATIGDVMPLLNENRIVVKHGLFSMKNTKNQGLKALLLATGLEGKELTPYHVGFILGPCLNATGRLDTAARALELFETTDWTKAVTLAAKLKELNDSRKDMTVKGVKEAREQIENCGYQKDSVLVVFLEECHESLAGIIAGRIREIYGKPTFVLTRGESEIKGSGRSIEAYSMYEEMTKHKELFLKYGGHRQAAGFSMEEKNVTLFRKKMNETCTLTEEDFTETIRIDIPMPMRYATREFVEELKLLEPFGNGNPKPLFAEKNLHFLRGRILGKNGEVGKYVAEDAEKNRFEVIFFGNLETFHTALAERFGEEQRKALYEGKKTEIRLSLCYYPEINEFRGKRTVQMVMRDYKIS